MISLICILSLSFVQSKFLKKTLSFEEGVPVYFLTKFGVENEGTYNLRAKITKSDQEEGDKKNLKLFIAGEDWNGDYTCEAFSEGVDLKVGVKSWWSDEQQGKLRKGFWNIFIADCGERNYKSMKMKVEITLYNENKSHFSVEMKSLMGVNWLFGYIYLILLGANIFAVYKYASKEFELKITLYWILVTILVQVLASICCWFHFSIYEFNGRGVTSLSLIGFALSLLCQLSISYLLLLISDGWTIKNPELPSGDAQVPMIILLVFVHCIVAVFAKFSEEQPFVYSDMEGWAGNLYFMIKLLILGLFIANIIEHLHSPSTKYVEFIKQFSVIGGFYLGTIPTIILMIKFVPEIYREILTIAAPLLVQTMVISWILYMLTYKTSYYNLSSVSNTILPTVKKHYL